jgi:mannose/fructose/N-acetylgalactosamine-specific phosphotransferase system component IIB
MIVPRAKLSEPATPIRWIRIDDRLIHGQVTVAWRQHLGYDEICIVDDALANDAFMNDMLRLAAPSGVQVTVYTVQQATGALTHPASNAILLLTKTPQSVLRLLDAGVPITQVNVGNIAAAPGRKRVFKSISLGPEHVATLDALAERGVEITFQLVPHDTALAWKSVRSKWANRK